MYLPVRCFTCSKVIGGKWDAYQAHLAEGLEPAEALDTLGMRRYCCRRMFLGHVNMIDTLLQFKSKGRGGVGAL
jgi:DNA-directed RNA polymerases I, II, and III subunit RPABC5